MVKCRQWRPEEGDSEFRVWVHRTLDLWYPRGNEGEGCGLLLRRVTLGLGDVIHVV